MLARRTSAGSARRLRQCAEQPAHQAVFKCLPMLAMKFFRPWPIPETNVAQESDWIAQDRSDHSGCLAKNVEQRVFEGDDRLDHTDRRVVDPCPQRLVFGAELFLHRRHSFVGLFVLIGQIIDQSVAALVDLGAHRVKIGAHLLQGFVAVLLDALVPVHRQTF